MAVPYKDAHDLLVAGIGTADKYHADWKMISGDLAKLVVDAGFDPKGRGVPDLIRAKVVKGVTEAAALRDGANAPLGESGGGVDASKKRVLALKTLRHLYYYESFGKQRIWILSLPASLPAYPMEYSAGDQTLVDRLLNLSNEKFSASTMNDLSEAAQSGLAWIQKAMMVAGSPFDAENRKLIRRWFVPAGTANETNKTAALAATLQQHLQKIAAGLKTGAIIVTDSPHERGSNSSLENSEAFVFTEKDLMVVHVENGFFSPQNTLSGKVNWARILVHELSHLYAKTKDHSYSWQGLVPRDADMLKRGNDAAVLAIPGFPAVRTLTFEECKENADSWAFFIADCAGALSDRDRFQALGNKVYELGKETMETPVLDTMKVRAGLK
jgi:hypothetical protein